MYKAVIFDMDGTILNTLEDLGISLRHALEERGHKCDFSEESIGLFFGSGIRTAFKRALAANRNAKDDELEIIGSENDSISKKYLRPEDEEEIDKLLEIYMPYYREHCNDNTKPYQGILQIINKIKAQGIKTAVVSNKPDGAVKILCDEVFENMFDFSLGERENIARKPAKDMIDICLENLQVKREEAIYIGDSEVDLLTAKNSNIPCLAVTWGFRGREFLEKHGAKIIIDKPEEIENYL